MTARAGRRAGQGLALLALAAVAALVWWDAGRTSPGPLGASHALVEDLVAASSCERCHGKAGQGMAAACLSCHAPIEDQLEAHRGLHGTLKAVLAHDCAKCHGEHRGHDFAPVDAGAFARAGVADVTAFDHAGLDFELTGKHRQLACDRCHQHSDAPLLHDGEPRYLGLQQACDRCHDDPHAGKWPDCASCHGQQQPFDKVAAFEHDRRFPLTGGHAELRCTACHEDDAPTAVATALERVAAGEKTPVRTCATCHASEHSSSFLAAIGDRLGVAASATCGSCHAADDDTFRRPAAKMDAALHATAGVPLSAPHDTVRCEQCHPPDEAFAARYPGRGADDCARCHDDPHRGQFTGDPLAANGCLGCHDRLTFTPPRFDAAMHANTALPLRGEHESLACDRCHVEVADAGGDPVRRFHGTDAACASCHDDPHGGQWSPAWAARGCAGCHDEQGFQRPRFDAAMHERTAFPLTGAHLAVGCDRCHEVARDHDGHDVRRFAGTGTACEGCHQDPHAGAFDRSGQPEELGKARGCARCHDTASFTEVPRARFDHGAWTGFALRGAHARTDCARCHEPAHDGVRPATPTDCAACHQDPHAGQFSEGGRIDCARCHTDGRSFAELTFDHGKDSRFPLEGQHAKLECSACHRPQPLADGRSAVRYRPLPTQCRDCHGPGPIPRLLR